MASSLFCLHRFIINWLPFILIKMDIINYAKTRETYIAYRKSGYSKKIYEAHRDEITLHKAAKEAFSKLPDGKIPKVKDLNEEFARLVSEKKGSLQ